MIYHIVGKCWHLTLNNDTEQLTNIDWDIIYIYSFIRCFSPKLSIKEPTMLVKLHKTLL